ncbi:acetyl-CoA carboxylase biotin carboxylase subunit [Aurantimonas endophytica]|uniref:propionyl-CoA carboxylase n=1 Tax=Aurantimonas endophytica TaxID=1522175 RepID=A0A7W6HAE6_9HYPH|nr:acetyl/propionyl/methylcrotonyl-CoA carboxylase subunit alpha [Aurantimonas endophytica]MBB4001441.1 propionyl-CoA carboxylase alpha chain [Aurantimonas endophytica]MCO6402917.1 acetyl-CoA carboxylase biotin carboxylase subunit [Aurantimonas endophytica]
MFKKILIANRGEIACRVIKTARAMGVSTVAVYSDADRHAVHVQLADQAVHIGPAPAAESYLVAEKILDACRETGAEAVHPGYGFLSERASFCELLEDNGIVFIGPKPRAIRAMGDKIESKLFAREAGVSIVPGHLGVVEDAETAVRIADEIGYPVMIKASAGGGGKGMRIAWNAAETREGFQSSANEARNSFGDDRIFIEKFIVNPRHIEIQVLADAHGNAIHLGERECSIQRRNQKVVEEAPSPFLDAATRAAMGAQAVALARAVDYQSAGTVEFIVDRDRNFYFLEMNTRLQVEHPVTELVTGIDLVEEMLRVAAGEKLRFAQEDIRLNGWAVESRIYAEDPFRGFLPSIGRLTRYRPPQEGASGEVTVRNDTGVREGSEISMYYDPMIAKLCTHAPDRATAIEAMGTALAAFEIEGIEHNIPFLAALMQHPRWREGRISTAFIAEEYPDGFERPAVPEATRRNAALIAISIEIARKARLDKHVDRLREHPGTTRREWVVRIDDDYYSVAVDPEAREGGQAAFRMSLDGETSRVMSAYRPGVSPWSGSIDGTAITAQVRPAREATLLFLDGLWLHARVMTPRIAELDRLMPVKLPPDTSRMLLCPMPGLVVSIAVAEGQAVKAGETLAVVEAMKMENILRAERDLTVASLKVRQGDSLAVDAVIMEFA